MKKLIFIIAGAMILSALSNLPIKATAGGYYTYNKALCARYLKLSHQALQNKNYARAKLFAKKAIQSDVFNRTAWLNYDLIVAKMAGGNLSLHSNTITVKSSAHEKSEQQNNAPTPSGGGAFVGC